MSGSDRGPATNIQCELTKTTRPRPKRPATLPSTGMLSCLKCQTGATCLVSGLTLGVGVSSATASNCSSRLTRPTPHVRTRRASAGWKINKREVLGTPVTGLRVWLIPRPGNGGILLCNAKRGRLVSA
jgi:hypothetical protein